MFFLQRTGDKRKHKVCNSTVMCSECMMGELKLTWWLKWELQQQTFVYFHRLEEGNSHLRLCASVAKCFYKQDLVPYWEMTDELWVKQSFVVTYYGCVVFVLRLCSLCPCWRSRYEVQRCPASSDYLSDQSPGAVRRHSDGTGSVTSLGSFLFVLIFKAEFNSFSCVPAGVWVGAGCSLSEVQSLLEKLAPQFPEEKTELFRALIRQLRNLGSQQIRNVAVRRRQLLQIQIQVSLLIYFCSTVTVHRSARNPSNKSCEFIHLIYFASLVSWRKHHERVPKLRPEPCFGCRELQSERRLQRWVESSRGSAADSWQTCLNLTSSRLWIHQEEDERFIWIKTSSWALGRRSWSRRKSSCLSSFPSPERCRYSFWLFATLQP